MLLFSPDVFFRLFEQYNAAIWPAQIIAYGLGLLLVLLALRPRQGGDRAVAAVLAAFWLWTGVVYHMTFFVTINWAAWAFGALFAIQGWLFLWSGALRGRVRFRFVPDPYGWTGLACVVFAMAAYPLIGWLAGHGWPKAPLFGVAPGPTTLFTLGMLLLAEPRVPLHLMLIPVLWAFLAGAAAWPLGMPEGLALPLAAVLAVVLASRKTPGRGPPV
jgi:hypothetical protein